MMKIDICFPAAIAILLSAAMYRPAPPPARHAGLRARSSVSASPCERCPDLCKERVAACKNGSVKACYLAAACLCRCRLNAGGCGSDRETLQRCVIENEQSAKGTESRQMP